jgi:hypothetical protein
VHDASTLPSYQPTLLLVHNCIVCVCVYTSSISVTDNCYHHCCWLLYTLRSIAQVTEKDEIIVDLVLTNADQAHEIEELKASLANKEAELAEVLSRSTT